MVTDINNRVHEVNTLKYVGVPRETIDVIMEINVEKPGYDMTYKPGYSTTYEDTYNWKEYYASREMLVFT